MRVDELGEPFVIFKKGVLLFCAYLWRKHFDVVGVDRFHHSAIYEMHQFVSFYRGSDQIAPNPPFDY